MNDSVMQLTLREMRAHFSAKPTLVILLGISCVLTLIGPFDSDTLLRFVPRFVYWLAITVLCYGVGFFGGSYVENRFGNTLPAPALIALSGTVVGIGVSIVVTLINYAGLGYFPSPQVLPLFLLNIFAIAFVITGVLHYVNTRPSAHGTEPTPAPKTPPILERIPLDKRGALIALSVEDHYVRVRTDKGEELILMRLGDAIKDTFGIKGLQVHRSHWVALDQVKAARREADRAILTMKSGADIPVSRRYVPDVKALGLLT